MIGGLSTMRDRTLVLGLALRGVAPGSDLITDDHATWWQVISQLVHALTHCVLLVVEMLLGVWFYCRT